MRRSVIAVGVGVLLACAGGLLPARAAERITLRNGFEVSCDHREPLDGERVRLFLDAAATSYLDVAAGEIASTETVSSLHPMETVQVVAKPVVSAPVNPLSLDTLIQNAGERRRLNVDLLRAVVQAESGGHVRAVSRAGAQGLMQLMPGTARSLGVKDSFAPEENLRGGTDYLDSLLRRYHDDLQLALAAYNAGPGAVDRWHGVPPYRETRAYVARIIHEFNRRTLLAQRSLAVAR